jgi:transcription elongation factor GreA
MTNAHYLTKSGYQKLEEELEELKKRKIAVADRIEEAIKMGDLSENAEYHDAKDEQAFIAGRTAEIAEILKNAEMIDEKSGRDGIVSLGCTVEVKANGKSMKFTIVGPEESAPTEGLISHESPLGKAFLNHTKGDKVDVETPAGKTIYTIVSVI